jgi:hypothetical protein
MERIIGHEIDVPERLAVMANKEKVSILMSTKFEDFKEWLMG